MEKNKLFKKDFTIMVLGQIISLFGNVILRFALSMFILDKTGSAATFATILAVSMVPTILLSSFGGIIADRVNRRNIMLILDFLTAIIIFIFTMILNLSSSIIIIAIAMILLSIIQAFYQPSVQSSIPLLVKEDKLISANGIVMQVNALANLLGPIIGGFLYGFLGIYPILIISGICFFISAVMECFLHIPFEKMEKVNGIFSTIKEDFKVTFTFITKEQKPLLKILILVAAINLFLSAMLIVGLPYIIKILLGLSSNLYGFAEGAMGIGSIIGGVCAGIIIRKLKFKKSYILLLGCSLMLLPIGFAIISTNYAMISYGIILACIIFVMGLSTLFSIYAQTIMQKLTPNNLLGKVSSVVTVISMCAIPLGEAIYGGLFEMLKNNSYIIIFIATFMCIIISLLSKKALSEVKVD